LIKKLTEYEHLCKLKNQEIQDLTRRFEEHMAANSKTEQSLNDRIDDLVKEAALIK